MRPETIEPVVEADKKAAADAAAAAAAPGDADADEEDEVDLNGVTIQRSWAWQFFEKIAQVDGSEPTHARCTLLPDPDAANQAKQHNEKVALSGGVRNLKRHLRARSTASSCSNSRSSVRKRA
jgi:hypothetical protein